jgi:hypothetical protein
MLTTNSHKLCSNSVCSKVTNCTWCAHNKKPRTVHQQMFATKSRTVHHDVLTTNSHELCMNRYLDLVQSLTLHLICIHLSDAIFGVWNNYTIWVQHSPVMWRHVVCTDVSKEPDTFGSVVEQAAATNHPAKISLRPETCVEHQSRVQGVTSQVTTFFRVSTVKFSDLTALIMRENVDFLRAVVSV